jgi:hypothetical protein
VAALREAGLAGATLSYSLDWMAVAQGRLGDLLRAARLLGAAESQWRASGMMRSPADDLAHEREVRAIQAQLAGVAFECASHDGLAMTTSRAMAGALDETS